ncbi:hypothetical protein MMU07_12070 [Aquiflexum sp. LQ15W]|uniref:hypothetical protein n=1 Tax=Cognataquiflexum nitidum TaxID=2922272 RepID=UPI001F13DDB3|nr:hypothetical protein [Cognataquiflexum nitidum]MCH6200319.1 hypothetical protein [Cognataquiflexum nitidum]
MNLTYSKQITLTYLIFSLGTAILFSIGKISLMPIAMGVTLYMLFFGFKTVMGFFEKNGTDKIDLFIYWGMTIQLSLQIALLFLKVNRYELLTFCTILFIAIIILCSRYKKKMELILLNFLIMMFSCTIYINF